jgi:hypothetical protein
LPRLLGGVLVSSNHSVAHYIISCQECKPKLKTLQPLSTIEINFRVVLEQQSTIASVPRRILAKLFSIANTCSSDRIGDTCLSDLSGLTA